MTQSFVRALARTARLFALATVVLGISAPALLAQGSTGKIEGFVRDQSEQPIANAQVTIVGTAFATTANSSGYYFFNSVPAGTYDLQVRFVGYKPQEVQGLTVISGQTITQSFAMEQSAVEIQAITVTAAQNPLVPRDQVATKQLISGDYTAKLPVDNMDQVFALQPGVVASPGATQLSVRGGRLDENTTYIDGVPVTSGNRGTGAGRNVPQVSVGTNAFADASITTGASSAEFGNAQGGVISISTRTGGQSYSGNLAIATDELSGTTMGGGFTRLNASLGGPIMGDLTFFVAGTIDGSRFGNFGWGGDRVPNWTAVSVDTTYSIPTSTSATADTLFLPVYNWALSRGSCDMPWVANAATAELRDNYGYKCRGYLGGGGGASSNAQATAKLNYSFGAGSRIALSYNGSRNLNRGGRGRDATFATSTTANVAILNWNQVLTRSSDRQIALDAYLSFQTNRAINSMLTPESEKSTRDPFLGMYWKGFDFQYDDSDFKVDDTMIRNYRLQQTDTPITLYDRASTQQYVGQNGYGGVIGNPGGIGGFGGAPGTVDNSYDRRWIGKVNLDWQVDRYNRIKIGGEYTDELTNTYAIGSSSAGFSDVWLAKPYRYNIFAEDRLDLGDVVLVGGVRYDAFKIGADKWKDFPRISSAVGFTADSLDNYLEPYKAHDYFSPHIQVAFPVTDRTNFRLSYSQAVQTPDYSVALYGSNTDLAITNTNNRYGTDLDFGKSVLFEFGVRHAFSDDMVLDVTVYNKDNLANGAGRLISRIDPRTGSNADLRLVVNQDFGNTRGLDLRLDRRFGQFFNGVLSYSYQDARNTGSDPFSYIGFGSRITSAVTGVTIPPPQSAQPVGYSRPHSITAQFQFNFPADYKQGTVLGSIMNRLGIYGTARYSSGTPYTRCDPTLDGDASLLGGSPCTRLAGDYNGARRPSYKNVDLRVTKGFRIGSLDLTAYADARNVLNLKTITNVFAQTGTTENENYAQIVARQDSLNWATLGHANDAYSDATGAMQLPGSDAECGSWLTTGKTPSPPTCYFLRKAEQRFGNGDGLYTQEEYQLAQHTARLSTFDITRFTGMGRRLRLGMEVNF